MPKENTMPSYGWRQTNLFDEVEASRLPPLNEALQQRVTSLLAQWLRELARTIETEASNEQDQR